MPRQALKAVAVVRHRLIKHEKVSSVEAATDASSIKRDRQLSRVVTQPALEYL
jgi:hypothetical protein